MSYRNIRLHPVLRLVYLLLRVVVWVSVKVFYRKRLVLGREHLHFDGPAIVIANHPSTLMDVLNPALEIRQEMFFLANYGLFRHPLSNWLFRKLYCIPVMRAEDAAPGESRNNAKAFELSFQHLEKNGVLFIAAEGTSWMNRFIRPLKSGAARIAFGAEARNNWNLEVKIIPIGLSYSAPNLFRSDVVVNVGAPVYARDWAEAWKENANAAVASLMQHLEDQLKTLSIHTRDEAGELLITRLEEILHHEHPLAQKAEFERSQRLAQTALDDPDLRVQTETYFNQLQEHRLTDAVVAAAGQPLSPLRSAAYAALLVLGFPFFALGYAFWFLPCFIPWWVNKKMNLYIGYSSTVKILVGLFVFPLALWGVFRGEMALGLGSAIAWISLPVWVILGLWVEQYQGFYRRFQTQLQTTQAAKKQAEQLYDLLQLRRAILSKIDKR